MTDPKDPDRVAAVRRAQARLLDLLAREVVRQLVPDQTPPAGPLTMPEPGPADDPEARERDDGCP